MIKIKEIGYHRNGVCGEGFYIILFSDTEAPIKHGVGIVFEGAGRVAVSDIGELVKGNIAFAKGNSWRGDHYEPEFRSAIKAKEEQARINDKNVSTHS